MQGTKLYGRGRIGRWLFVTAAWSVMLLAWLGSASADDWPEYLHDSQRNARNSEPLAPPLHLQWVHTPAQKPAHAWPPSAAYDFYHSHPLQLLATYDHVFEVIAAEGKVFFASSADDGLHCLDAASGKELWVYYAEGPARMAPAYAEGKVILAADDGQLHAVDAKTGRRIWAARPTPTDLRIAGTGRIISMWPNRTGVVLSGKVVYVVFGLFPSQKLYVAAVSLDDGKVIAVKETNQPVQGYVRHWKDRLLAPRGQQPQWTVAGNTDEQAQPNAPAIGGRVAKECPHVQIAAGDVQFGGANGKVAAYRVTVQDGKENAERLWESAVDGQARSLAAAGGRLFASTNTGKIYCFAAKEAQAAETAPEPADAKLEQSALAAAASVSKLLADNAIIKGYALVLSDGGDLAGALAKDSQLQVICVVDGADKAQQLARRFAAAGLAGRVSVHHVPSNAPLPYARWLFDIVTHDGITSGKALEARREKEALRVLRPYGGLALLGDGPKVTLKTAPLAGAGEWSHFYANADNNTCSGETLVGDKLRLQWFGEPGPLKMVDRHNRNVAPLCKDGRMFVSGRDYLYCVNSFNGAILWEQPVPNSMRIHGPKVAGNMAVADEAVYIASGPNCIAFDPPSGKQVRTFSAGEKCEWSYVGVDSGLLLGSRSGPGAHIRQFQRMSWTPGYYAGQPNICSFDVFAFDRASGKRLWTYEPKTGVIINTTILIAGGRLCFIESKNPQTKNVGNSRLVLPHLLGQGSDLVALDLKTGREALRVALDLKKTQHQLWMAHANGVLLVTGIRTAKAIFNDMWAIDAASGNVLWTKAHLAPGKDLNGAHGELTNRPAIIGDRILVPIVQYELKTGNLIEGWQWARGGGGCGAISTSATHVYNRGSNPHMMNLTTGKGTRITSTTRPGCWINIIAACGMLLIPEGSSGCHCPYQIQTSLGFVAAEE